MGEVGDSEEGGNSAAGSSIRDDVEEPLDLVREKLFQDSNAPMVGDGRGVISSIAAICGEDRTEPGDMDPADEPWRIFRTLGTRLGRLAAEALERNLISESKDCTEPERRARGFMSVLIDRPLNKLVAS